MTQELIPSARRRNNSDPLARASIKSYLRSRGVDPDGPLQLDMWADDLRAAPNDYNRSSLFTVRSKKEPRAVMQGAVLYHLDKSFKITYTGIELRAYDDQKVWQQIIHYARNVPLGEAVGFNLHQLAKDIGWGRSSSVYQRLRECISRLKANEVRLTNTRYGRGMAMSLIENYAFEGENEANGTRYQVWIHPDLMVLFAGGNYSLLVWESYRDLSSVARRLYDYIASHKQPYPLALDAFHAMCGSACKSASKWTQIVKEACVELKEAKLVQEAIVNDGKVCVQR